MRKCLAILLLFMLFVSAAAAETVQKAPDFIMEGYDGDGSNHVWESNLFFERMQERTGVSFQFRQFSDYEGWTERKKALQEGEDLPDVLFKAGLTPSETGRLYAGGIIIDLKPYLAEYAPTLWGLLESHPDWMAAITLEDGSIPALPAFNELPNNDAVWINTDWLKAVKMEMPSDAETLTEVLRAFKTGDPNRNGKADEVPLTFIGMWELRFLGHAFGMIDNDYYMTLQEDGKVVSHLKTDENRAFLTWLHSLWQEDLLDHRGFSNVDSLRQITDGKAAIPYGVMLSTTPLTVVPSEALNQYSLLPPLTWQGERIYRDLLGDVIRGTFAITRECKEPEKLVAWVDYLYTEEGSRLAQSGKEGEEYVWNEDGYWEWMNDATTVANVTLPQATIGEGGSAPGYMKADFQLKYSDAQARRMIEMLAELKSYARLPYPFVTLSETDAARISELQRGIASYAEETMATFVTGDTELNDDTWAEFCRKLDELGLEEMTALWQKYADARKVSE